MRWPRRFFNFYLDASIHVALSVCCCYLLTVNFMKVSTNWQLVAFLFFGTIICYNFIKYGVEAKKYLLVSNPYHKVIQVFSFLSGLCAAYFFLFLNRILQISIVFLAFLSILYAVPFLEKNKNLRSYGGLKVFLVALVWAGCTVYLPAMDDMVSDFDSTVPILLLQRFLLVLVLILPFEIRDLKFDDKELRTLPQRLGVANTKKLGYGLLVVFLLFTFLNDQATALEWCYRVMVAITLAIFLYFTHEERPRYYSQFWVESVPILSLLGVSFY